MGRPTNSFLLNWTNMLNFAISEDFSKWVYRNHRLASYLEMLNVLPRQVARTTQNGAWGWSYFHASPNKYYFKSCLNTFWTLVLNEILVWNSSQYICFWWIEGKLLTNKYVSNMCMCVMLPKYGLIWQVLTRVSFLLQQCEGEHHSDRLDWHFGIVCK